MSEIFEMRSDAQDASHHGGETQRRIAGIHPIPSNGGDGSQLMISPHVRPAAVAKSPRKRERPAMLSSGPIVRAPAATNASQEAGEAIDDLEPNGQTPPSKTPYKGRRTRGQKAPEALAVRAAGTHQFGSPTSIETQRPVALDDDPGFCRAEAHRPIAGVVNLIAEIRGLWRRRQRWHKAEKSLTLQCFAICWSSLGGGTETKKLAAKLLARIEDGEAGPDDLYAEVSAAPLLAARAVIREQREAVEKTLGKLARRLPAYEWIKKVRGVGDLSYAAIVGEAGAPGDYKSVSALWKRMGLAVIDGGRQRRVSGDAALDHGYAPARRSVMWNIGGGLIGGAGKGPRPGVGEDVAPREDLSPYQKLFVDRLRYEAARDPEKHRKEPVASAKTGQLRESFSVHAANRAKRYVEKRFLRDLYAEWRRASLTMNTLLETPASDPVPA